MTAPTNDTQNNVDHPIRVLCVDDHAFVVEGLRARLGEEADIDIIGSLSRADELSEHVESLKPDVVLLDVDMPGRDVFEAIDDLSRSAPHTRCVLLSGYIRDTYLDAAVKNGAWGYLSKQDEPAAIADAIRKVNAGHVAFSADVNERCATHATDSQPTERNGAASKLALLTPRELQILRMIGRGMARNDIAASIHRSPKTVDAHRASIMDKLGLHDRVDLARFAIREGLVEA